MMSILDNDFYKFTMQQAVIRLFPYANARYTFINRGKHTFPSGFAGTLRDAVGNMAGLQLTREEKYFLKFTCPYLDPVYLDFLEGFRYDPEEIQIAQNDDGLQVNVEGLWYRTILWEVPLMSQISELFYAMHNFQRVGDEEINERTREKIRKYADLNVKVAELAHGAGIPTRRMIS